jgi:hypothetical protein
VRVWQVLLLYIAAFALYYERIIFAEESFLRQNFGETFNEWASRTPAFFPRLGNWIKPDLPFSWKMALSREYHGVLGLISSLFMMELVSDFYLTGEFLFDRFWVIARAMGMFFYLTVRLLDKKTSLLEAEKR